MAYQVRLSFLNLGYVLIGLALASLIVQYVFNATLSGIFGTSLTYVQSVGLVVVSRLLQK